ncbi:MAG: hypothetical protein JSV88_27285 [Candidatus Aminicenantes bacterium]|nr:MAG: hypothetical protein JSV88_27285 [Candidatus Aminicenantes bacterium]
MVKKLWVILIPIIVLTAVCKKNDSLLPPPVLISPPNGATVTENPPTFVWEKCPQKPQYDIQVSEDESFVQAIHRPIMVDSGLPTTTISYTLDSELSPGTYYWRVRWGNDCFT